MQWGAPSRQTWSARSDTCLMWIRMQTAWTESSEEENRLEIGRAAQLFVSCPVLYKEVFTCNLYRLSCIIGSEQGDQVGHASEIPEGTQALGGSSRRQQVCILNLARVEGLVSGVVGSYIDKLAQGWGELGNDTAETDVERLLHSMVTSCSHAHVDTIVKT